MSDTCDLPRGIHPDHPRGDRFWASVVLDPADDPANAELIELLDGAEWAGQVRSTVDSTTVLAEFDFTVDVVDGVLTAVGIILDTDDFETSNVFDFQATPTGGGSITFLAGSTITVIGDVTRVTGS